MHVADVVGYVFDREVYCPCCVNDDEVMKSAADAMKEAGDTLDDAHAILAGEEGWEDFTCEGCGASLGEAWEYVNNGVQR